MQKQLSLLHLSAFISPENDPLIMAAEKAVPHSRLHIMTVMKMSLPTEQAQRDTRHRGFTCRTLQKG